MVFTEVPILLVASGLRQKDEPDWAERRRKMNIDADVLDRMVEKGRELKELLANKDILRFMELMASMDGQVSVVPVRSDTLLYPSEVRRMLRISNSTLKEYCNQGLLTAYHTPPKGKTKFWLSQVLAIPVAEEGGTA